MKLFIWKNVGLAAFLALILVACSAQEETAPTSAPPPEENEEEYDEAPLPPEELPPEEEPAEPESDDGPPPPPPPPPPAAPPPPPPAPVEEMPEMAAPEPQRMEQRADLPGALLVQDCLARGTCLSVNVMFGTNREIIFGQQVEAFNRFNRVAENPFQENDAGFLTLGEIDITVPLRRTQGEIQTPRRFRIPGTDIEIGQRLNPESHFVFVDYRKLSEQEFGNGLQEASSAFIFIHGFNVPFKTAAMRAAQLKVDADFEGQPIIYSWPTKSFDPLDLDASNYQESQENAIAARDDFKEFLEIVRANTDAAIVHIIAHSMGNFMMMDVLAEMNEERALDADPYFGEIILAAPDVDRASFSSLAGRMAGISNGVTLYASSRDLAMEVSLRLCQSQATSICADRAGFVSAAGPVIANRVDTIDVSGLDQTFFDSLSDFGHGYFGGDRTVIGDIERLMKTGLRPPPARTSSLAEVGLPPIQYWRYE